MDFRAPLSVEQMAEIIAAELRERMGSVRLESGLLQACVDDMAKRAAGLWCLTNLVREGTDPQADKLVVPLIHMADRLIDELLCIAGDERMKHSLAYDVTLAAVKIASKNYPLVVARELRH